MTSYAVPPPDDAYIVSSGGVYKHYVWPTLRGLLPTVNWHITFEGDIDAPCVCRASPLTKETMEILWDALMQSRVMAHELLLGKGWRISGEPIYVQSCTHDLDPRH